MAETVFSYPGIGTLAYESARYKDYNLLMIISLMSGIIIIACNMAAQILNERIDRECVSAGSRICRRWINMSDLFEIVGVKPELAEHQVQKKKTDGMIRFHGCLSSF